MQNDLNGKVAAITGAASGIGLECAKALLAAGATVVLVDRAEEKLCQLCAELGPQALPLVVDLADPSSVSEMLPQILKMASKLGNYADIGIRRIMPCFGLCRVRRPRVYKLRAYGKLERHNFWGRYMADVASSCCGRQGQNLKTDVSCGTANRDRRSL